MTGKGLRRRTVLGLAALACSAGLVGDSGLLSGPPAAARPAGFPLEIDRVTPGHARQGQRLRVTLEGHGYRDETQVSFGEGITIHGTVVAAVPAREHILRVDLTVAADAAVGARDITLTNPDEEPLVVQDGFQVQPAAPGKMVLTPAKKLEFPKVKVGKRRIKDLIIKNTGQGVLLGEIDAPLKGEFRLNPNQDAFTIPPGRKVVLKVEFTPFSRGKKTARINFTSSDPRRAKASVLLTGQGRK